MEVQGNALLIGGYECPLCACSCVSMQQQWDLEIFLPKLDALSKATEQQWSHEWEHERQKKKGTSKVGKEHPTKINVCS